MMQNGEASSRTDTEAKGILLVCLKRLDIWSLGSLPTNTWAGGTRPVRSCLPPETDARTVKGGVGGPARSQARSAVGTPSREARPRASPTRSQHRRQCLRWQKETLECTATPPNPFGTLGHPTPGAQALGVEQPPPGHPSALSDIKALSTSVLGPA